MHAATFVVFAVLTLALVGCDSGPRYEERGDIIVDTRTGLTYDAEDAKRKREAYRDMMAKQGQSLPGVPLVLTQRQRDELEAWEERLFRERQARNEAEAAVAMAEWEPIAYASMLREQGREVPDGLVALSHEQRDELDSWVRLLGPALDYCEKTDAYRTPAFLSCIDRKMLELWETSLPAAPSAQEPGSR